MVKLFFDKGQAAAPPVPAAPLPEGIKNIVSMVDTVMPAIEGVTGLTRREITLQLLKTGFRGGNLSGFLDGLMGKPPEKEVRFVRIVKTLAIWIPVSLMLFGLSIVTVFLYAKLIMHLMGI